MKPQGPSIRRVIVPVRSVFMDLPVRNSFTSLRLSRKPPFGYVLIMSPNLSNHPRIEARRHEPPTLT